MKLLLDECVTRYVKPDFIGHDVFTIEEAGLKGLKNGALLRAASGRFDALITVDEPARSAEPRNSESCSADPACQKQQV